jgi:hypothetical protein
MLDFWQTPTGSMGVGLISWVYRSRFIRYLRDRGLLATDGSRVRGIFGDAELDEPESIAGLSLAARQKLEDLTFVIDCNLERLGIDPGRGRSNFGGDRGRTKAPAAYEARLVAVAPRQVCAENALGLYLPSAIK